MTSSPLAEPPLSMLSSTKPLVLINVNTSVAWKRRNPIRLLHPRLSLHLVLAIPNLSLSQTPLRQTWSLNLTLPNPINLMVLSRMPKKLVANKTDFVSIAPILLTSGPIVLDVSPRPLRLTPSRSLLLILTTCLPFLPAPSSFSRETAILKPPRGRRLEPPSAHSAHQHLAV